MSIVAKEFKTTSRKMKVGADVFEADIDGPLTFEDWKNLGFIEDAPVKPEPFRAKAPSAPMLPKSGDD